MRCQVCLLHLRGDRDPLERSSIETPLLLFSLPRFPTDLFALVYVSMYLCADDVHMDR